MTQRLPRILGVLVLAVGLAGMRPTTSFAATVNDCPTTESGLNTDIANAGSGGTVTLTCSTPTTISFRSPIMINQSVTLTASGTVTLDGSSATQLFYVNGVTLTLMGLTLTHGRSGYGGTIFNAGTLQIGLSTFSTNIGAFGGAIDNGGTVTITQSTFSGNSSSEGGAIYSFAGTVAVTSSTFSGDAAGYGGAIDSGAAASIDRSTFSGNISSYGGAIRNWGTATVTASTFSGNTAYATGGAIDSTAGTLGIGASIIAASIRGGNCSGSITDNGYNLSDDTSCPFSLDNHDLLNTDPHLGPLQNNGGPTATMALLPTSPAIDRIPTSFANLCPAPGVDQWGDARPDSGESVCDIGAYEFQNDTTTTLTSAANPSVYGQAVTFTAAITPTITATTAPTGTVDFFDGGTKIGSDTVSTSGGVTTGRLTTNSLAVGNHTVTATYRGDSLYSGSSTEAAQAVTQIVTKAGTTTTLTTVANPTVAGQPLTVTATVRPVAPGAGTPTGTVQFKIDGTDFGSPPALSGGKASVTTSTLLPGSYAITASYSGDASFLTSTSPPLTVQLTLPTSSNGSAVVASGSTACTTVVIAAKAVSGAVGGSFYLQDMRPGGNPCGPANPGTVILQQAAISAVACTSHTTASVYGRAQQVTAPRLTPMPVTFRADVAITSTWTFNGIVSVQTSSRFNSAAAPAAVRITGC